MLNCVCSNLALGDVKSRLCLPTLLKQYKQGFIASYVVDLCTITFKDSDEEAL